MAVYQATVTAPVNIACIKYWGKRDNKLILPTNSSLSVTLDQDHLRSTTTSRADPSFPIDRLWLNGKEDEIKEGGRMATCIQEMKRLRKEEVEDKNPDEPQLSTYHVHICSHNNFPTAAGLASSASGFAALVYSLALLYQLPVPTTTLSRIARQGSGSACRSLFGGFVFWQMGSDHYGSDSFGRQVAPESHWPDMHALICIVSGDKKGTSSTSGMRRSVKTSTLLDHRIDEVVPDRIEIIVKAIVDKDFDTFARMTMADSNQFHAIALDTEPPIFYMNDISREIISIIVEYNRLSVAAGTGYKAAYTFDAGPNAVIYALDKDMKEIIELIVAYFPQEENSFKDVFDLFGGSQLRGQVPTGFDEKVAKLHGVGVVKGLIHTRIGDGPRKLGEEEALLNAEGFPQKLGSRD